MDPWLWISRFVLLSYPIEAVTGFGSLVIALALGALLLPVAELLPVLVPLNVLMSGSLVLRHRRYLFFQAEDGIRDGRVPGVQTCALPISTERAPPLPT